MFRAKVWKKIHNGSIQKCHFKCNEKQLHRCIVHKSRQFVTSCMLAPVNHIANQNYCLWSLTSKQITTKRCTTKHLKHWSQLVAQDKTLKRSITLGKIGSLTKNSISTFVQGTSQISSSNVKRIAPDEKKNIYPINLLRINKGRQLKLKCLFERSNLCLNTFRGKKNNP